MTIKELTKERISASDSAELLQNLLDDFKDAAQHESRDVIEKHFDEVVFKIKNGVFHFRAIEELKHKKIQEQLKQVSKDKQKLHTLSKELSEFNAISTMRKINDRDKIFTEIGLVTSRLMQNLGTDQLVNLLESEKLLQSE